MAQGCFGGYKKIDAMLRLPSARQRFVMKRLLAISDVPELNQFECHRAEGVARGRSRGGGF
jgi:hypothetical protein